MYFRMKQILQEKSNTFENIIDTNNIFKINNTDIQSKKILKYF